MDNEDGVNYYFNSRIGARRPCAIPQADESSWSVTMAKVLRHWNYCRDGSCEIAWFGIFSLIIVISYSSNKQMAIWRHCWMFRDARLAPIPKVLGSRQVGARMLTYTRVMTLTRHSPIFNIIRALELTTRGR